MLFQRGEEESLLWMMEAHLETADILPLFEACSLAGVYSSSTSFVLSFFFSPFTHTHSQETGRYGNNVSFWLISVALEGELEGFYV